MKAKNGIKLRGIKPISDKEHILDSSLEKAYEFMKQFVINGRNMLDVFRERIGEVKEWVNRKVARMGR